MRYSCGAVASSTSRALYIDSTTRSEYQYAQKFITPPMASASSMPCAPPKAAPTTPKSARIAAIRSVVFSQFPNIVATSFLPPSGGIQKMPPRQGNSSAGGSRFQHGPRVDARAAEEVRGGERLAARALHSRERERAVAASDHEARPLGRDHLTRLARARHRGGLPHFQGFAAEARLRSRNRIEAAHLPLDCGGGA